MPDPTTQQDPNDDLGLHNHLPVGGPDQEESDPESPDPDPKHLLPFPVVGIGASAGGVEAYIDLFRNLPANTGMAYILVPHLRPDQKSRLVEILTRCTSMPVREIEEHTSPQADHVYILPPNNLVTMSGGVLLLEPRPAGVTLSIDHFFYSLAADQKTNAVGVVLSGMDSDGALGLKTIKGEGGISIVQDPESARFPSMPRSSIAADHVDLIIPPNRIATELARLGRHFASPALYRLERGESGEGDTNSLAQIFGLLRGVSALDFAEYKPGTVLRRIARRMILKKVDSLPEYVAHLQEHGEELRQLLEDLLINVTRFFRDPAVFQAVIDGVLPRIFSSRPPDQQTRVWVAGCSTGEEVYSLAICFLEYFDSNPAHRSLVQIFGTDASDWSIRSARAGIFPETLSSQISPERLRRFFVKLDKGYQISKRVRDLCVFARQSLSSDPPYSQLDLVSCRNVLIYLNQRLQDQIVRTFHYALRAAGCLMLGKAETLHQHGDLFQPLDRINKLYTKIPGGERSGFEMWGRFLPETGSAYRDGEKRGNWSEGELQRAVDRMIVSRFDLLGVVVDEHLNIVFTRGRSAPFLEMASGASSLQLMRMVRSDISVTVKDAVQRAIAEDIPVQVEVLQVQDGDRARDVVIEVLPLHNAGLAMRCFLILFGPRETQPGRAVGPAPEALELQNRDETVDQLKRDLTATKRYIQSLIEDRDIKNQELISASEEAQSQNEELQSTNEELETTKEEIQSANEELQTVNDELQQRNVSLTHIGNDLTNLLSSVNLPMLMLNNEMQIRQFTPAAQRIMSVRSSDIGRPLHDIRIHLSIGDFEPIVREVIETLGTKEIEVQDHEQRWHLLRVRPYRTTENKIEGVVLLLIDIEESRRAQRELRESRDFAQAIIHNVQVPLVVLNPDCRIRTANTAFRDLAQSTGNIEGRSFPDLVIAQWGMREIGSHLDTLRERGSGASFYFEHVEPRPGGRSLAVRGLELQAEGEQALLLMVEDVTLRKQAEEVLMRERNTLLGQVQSGERHLERTRDELRRLAAQLFASQEEERRRVARELHDDITQRLALLKMSLDQFALDVPEEQVRRRLEPLRKQAAAITEDVRVISHRLHPAILDDLGLPIALRVLSEEFGAREGMPATFSQQNISAPIPHELAGSMYRIAQEALRNVAKHAGKTHVKVSLEETGNSLRMEVVDFGQGFDPKEVHGGLGLISMVERARLVAGVVSVLSAPGRGTAITVEVPLPPP